MVCLGVNFMKVRIPEIMKHVSLLCHRCNQVNPMVLPKRHHGAYDPDGRTTVSILNKEMELGLMIDSYSQVGFRLNNGMVVLGPMAIFSRSVFSWNVAGFEEINDDSLSLFQILEPKLDILVVGVGNMPRSNQLNKNILEFMARHHINVEVLPTDQACATFNFLNAERRCVGAAIIPPTNLRFSDDDVIQSKLKHKKIYQFED